MTDREKALLASLREALHVADDLIAKTDGYLGINDAYARHEAWAVQARAILAGESATTSALALKRWEITTDPAVLECAREDKLRIEPLYTEPPAGSAAPEPVAHSEQWWLHRLDMEKTAAWQQGYAQGLHRATPATTTS